MKLSEELAWRGFVNQTTYSDLSVLDGQKVTFYHGFDASADSQTIGNLAGMMMDRLFMKHGHRAVILAGGATSLIGDPGGKDSERPLQDEATIAANVAEAEQQLKKVFTGHEYKLVNNLEWTRDLKVIEFLRDIGKHFSMTPLIQRDFIAKRLGEGGAGISYAEFSYTILQGMDFLHLFDAEGVSLQLGGSDQWGNCLSGVELIRRARGGEAHVITLPLIINKATGVKFGKSEEGAIWLDPAKTTPTQFYQFWINTEDDAVEDYLKIFTELDEAAIEDIMSQFNSNRSGRLAQKTLAGEVTKLVHGEEALAEAEKQTGLFINVADHVSAGDSTPQKLMTGITLVDALITTNLAASNTEARRLIDEGGVYLNNNPVTEEGWSARSPQTGRFVLRRGKKLQNSALIELE